MRRSTAFGLGLIALVFATMGLMSSATSPPVSDPPILADLVASVAPDSAPSVEVSIAPSIDTIAHEIQRDSGRVDRVSRADSLNLAIAAAPARSRRLALRGSSVIRPSELVRWRVPPNAVALDTLRFLT